MIVKSSKVSTSHTPRRLATREHASRRSRYLVNCCVGSAVTVFAVCLAGCGPGKSGGETASQPAAEVAWPTDDDAALAQPRADGKPVVIDFFAPCCGPCKMMERNTCTEAKVQQRMAGFVPLKIDVDRQPEIAQRYGIEGLPTTAVVEADGKPVSSAVGYLDAKEFLAVLDAAKPGALKADSEK